MFLKQLILLNINVHLDCQDFQTLLDKCYQGPGVQSSRTAADRDLQVWLPKLRMVAAVMVQKML